VNVVGGVIYGATGDSAFALQASTGKQLWTKKLTRNKTEGIDGALKSLLGHGWGVVAVFLIALGFAAFGIYSVARAWVNRRHAF